MQQLQGYKVVRLQDYKVYDQILQLLFTWRYVGTMRWYITLHQPPRILIDYDPSSLELVHANSRSANMQI